MGLENLPLTTRDAADVLHDKQLQTWEVTRRGFANWLIERGKNPKSLEGYSEYTAKDTLYRTNSPGETGNAMRLSRIAPERMLSEADLETGA
ncbi:hypothetical protein [Natronomonas amylolytica]|uniref:hypothetical protein n=1 Tax=Natronomonas amylolytica TaxID=3108498 RepID=UPI00300B1D09